MMVPQRTMRPAMPTLADILGLAVHLAKLPSPNSAALGLHLVDRLGCATTPNMSHIRDSFHVNSMSRERDKIIVIRTVTTYVTVAVTLRQQ